MLNLNMKPSLIGIRCPGTRKCSQRYEIDHFCQWHFSAIQLSKSFPNPVGEPSVQFIKLQLEKFSELEVGVF